MAAKIHSYTVAFWQSGTLTVYEGFPNKREACRAIAGFVRERLDELPRLRRALVREGSAHRDGSVVVKHKAGGREFGAYIDTITEYGC